MTDDALLTSAEVAQLLRVHPKHLYRLLRRGLPGHRLGRGHWRFRRHEVLAWAATRSADESGPARAGQHDAGLSVELVGTGARLCLGRVGDRWVGHAMSSAVARSADGLRSAAADRVQWLSPSSAVAHNVLVAGCAPVLGVVLDQIESQRSEGRCHWIAANSADALSRLGRGLVHVAGVHLQDPQTGADHAAVVRSRLGHDAFRIVELVRWRAGLVTRPDDPRTTLDDLIGARWVLRERGAGAHDVLVRALAGVGTATDRLGVVRTAADHLEVARTVAFGAADVGVCVEPVARELGLRILPLEEERFDLVVLAEHLDTPSVRSVLAALDSPALRRQIAATGPYDAAGMGQVSAP